MPARAWGEVLLQLLGQRMGTHLEHLDVRDGQMQVRRVAEDQRCTEKKTDGQDAPEEHVFRHVNIFRAVYEVCCPLEDAGADSLTCLCQFNAPRQTPELPRSQRVSCNVAVPEHNSP